jgi:hypothetical protein
MTDRARANSSVVTAVPGFGFHGNPRKTATSDCSQRNQLTSRSRTQTRPAADDLTRLPLSRNVAHRKAMGRLAELFESLSRADASHGAFSRQKPSPPDSLPACPA